MILWFPIPCSLLAAAASSSFSQGSQIFPRRSRRSPGRTQKLLHKCLLVASGSCAHSCASSVQFGTRLSHCFLGFPHYLGWKQHSLTCHCFISVSCFSSEQEGGTIFLAYDCKLFHTRAARPWCDTPVHTSVPDLPAQWFWPLRAVCRPLAGPILPECYPKCLGWS